MNPIALGWFLVSIFLAAGAILWFVARPLAKLCGWWYKLWNRQGFFWSSLIVYDEKTALAILRLAGVFFAVIGAILIIVLPFAQSLQR